MLYGEDAAVFAGFTSATYDGVVGGREKMNSLCGAAFTGAHLCHIGEYHLTDSATSVPASGAWIDASGGIETSGAAVLNELASRDVGRYTDQLPFDNCDNWTATSDGGNTTSGALITPAGGSSAVCTTNHQLACCTTPYKEVFLGYTSAVTSGVAGGRNVMHSLCGAAFPSSHMCHVAEYYRAEPTAAPPASGAWLDYSGFPLNSAGAQVTSAIADIHSGRYAGQLPFGNCDNWSASTDGGNTTSGLTITSSGATTAVCTTTHPVACCE
jgi:hypothetical protein